MSKTKLPPTSEEKAALSREKSAEEETTKAPQKKTPQEEEEENIHKENTSKHENRAELRGTLQDINMNTFYRENVLLVEYKSLQKYSPTGVYVLPAEDTLHVWHGVIFVRQGLYRGGIFKFIIYMPDDFPDSCPFVKFTSNIFHPQFDDSGRLDVLKAFPSWKRGRDRIWHVLAYMKQTFYKIEVESPANLQAADLFTNNFEVFSASVKACVLESIDNQYVFHRGSSLRFFPWKSEIHETARKQIFSVSKKRENFSSI
eukprot:Sdes_comp15594_c0_seq1m4579